MIDLIKREVAKEIFKIEQRKSLKRWKFEEDQKRRAQREKELDEEDEQAT